MILVLGGTAEARELAAALHERGVAVTTSLAGRVARPRLPPGEVRIGGFGGPDRLAEWLLEHRVGRVIDATHPFAERISASAARACEACGVPLLRLERPGFRERPGDGWRWVDDLEQAARALEPGDGPTRGARVFLTTGRQGLPAFAESRSSWFLVRCVDPPEPPLPPRHELILDRGPFSLAGELGLIDRHRIDVLVTKDSGGEYTSPKLDAARARGLAVIVVRRPPRPDTRAVASVEEAVAWATLSAHPG